MPNDKTYTITIKIKDKSQSGGNEKTKICVIDFDATGNTPVPIDSNGNPLKVAKGYTGHADNIILEGFDDENPSWVKIGGKWYYI